MLSKKLLLLKFFILFINYCYCQYDYNVTLYLGSNNLIGLKGKAIATFEGGNGLYNHTEKLSSIDEDFTPDDIKQYKTAAPWPIEYIEKVVIRIKSVDKSFIYVDKVIVNPIYLQNQSERKLSIREYCATDIHANVGNIRVPFWIKC